MLGAKLKKIIDATSEDDVSGIELGVLAILASTYALYTFGDDAALVVLADTCKAILLLRQGQEQEQLVRFLN